MASVTKSNNEKSAMADDELPDEIEPADEPREDKPKRPKSQDQGRPADVRRADAGGYFTLYKRGQGYWTRVGTVIGAAIIGIFTAYNLYAYVPTFLPERVPPAVGIRIGLGVAVGFAVGFAWLCWHLLNKPANADFLIATDSEMKKVNWTSRRELIGSTKVVIAFMFLTALFLFLCDNVFVFLMKQIGVLKFGYFGS